MEFWGARRGPPVLFLPAKFIFFPPRAVSNPPPKVTGFALKPAALF